MKTWKVLMPVLAVLMMASPSIAQTDEEASRDAEAREAEMDRKLREAEDRMTEAARQIAEITRDRLPHMAEIERRIELSDKPRLGVTIDGRQQKGPVEGVEIMGVTPGSAASDAGLRSGDVITAINDESLSAASADEANSRLLDFMQGVEEGDVLNVEYLRNGKVGSVEIEPRAVQTNMFVWRGDRGSHFTVPPMPNAPHSPHAPAMVEKFKMEFGFPWAGSGFGELELVELNEGLGRYFGADRGLLVIEAPESDAFGLQDGDVIQSIDGREPRDVRHAMRILGSYQSGEKLKLGIMRDKKKRTLDVEIPINQQGMLFDRQKRVVRPARAPLPPKAPAPVFETTRT